MVIFFEAYKLVMWEECSLEVAFYLSFYFECIERFFVPVNFAKLSNFFSANFQRQRTFFKIAPSVSNYDRSTKRRNGRLRNIFQNLKINTDFSLSHTDTTIVVYIFDVQ